MKLLFWIVLVVAALAAIHALALWAERRGWIYYLHTHASPGTRAGAFLEMQSLVDPGTRHIVASRAEEGLEEDDSGAPPSPDGEGESGERTEGANR